MAETESLQSAAQTPAPLSTWFGVVLLFFLFGIVVFAVVGPSPRGDNYEQTRAKKRAENLKTLREEQSKALTSYAWVDKNKGTVRIPIDQAVQLTIAELSAKKVGPGGPIVVAAPAGSPPEAAAPSPSASAAPHGKSAPKPTSAEGPQSENRAQPAAAANPPNAQPGTQPGANASPAASPASSAARPAVSPNPNPNPAASGSPLPVRGGSSPSPSPH